MSSESAEGTVRAAIMLGCLLLTGTAQAQTAAPAPHIVIAKKPARPHPKKVPVVAPRHGASRKPVHPASVVVAAKPKPVPAAKPAAAAKPALPADEGSVTHLHIPRYVSVRSDEANMRSGPGERYPVLWQYRRRDLPVKIEREFDVWRLIEDMDGVKGWVNQALLAGHRTFVVTGTEPATLRDAASPDATPVALLKPGVIGRVLGCDAGAAWCHVQTGDYSGYLLRASFWGTDPGEAVVP
jgi:SH3-like domain-containing protein